MKTIYALAAAALLSLTACSSDDIAEQQSGGTSEADGSIRVHLRVSAGEGTNKTRAWTDEENATTEEMMHVWTVVAVNTTDNKVTSIYACKPSGEPDQEIDDYVELPAAGTYRFYSFANMSPKVVMSLLDIGGYGKPTKKSSTRAATAGSAYGTPTGDTSNDNLATGSVTSHAAANETDPFMAEPTQGAGFDVNTYYTIPFDAGETLSAEDVASKTVNVAGNNFNLEATDNGFGAKGIPMSNVQTITVTEGMTLDLIVIRMMAKIQLQIYNDRGSDVTLESFTITDVTKNATGNLKLLPKLTTGANTMSYVHGDIKPNLPDDVLPECGNLILKPASGKTISATDNKTDGGTPVTFTFYVNESNTPDNGFNRFFLKIKLSGESEQRYVLIDDANAEGKTDTWNYIARNDFRIIPVVLDDYKLDIIPYDFPAIGVYPASVKEEDGLYTINFHDYGHFHLLPKVTKLSDSSVVPFSPTTPDYSSTAWGLVDNDFTKSWTSWTDATKATAATDDDTDDDSFYRSGYTTDPPVDGDEVGGFPVWYKNDGVDGPRWDPAGGTSYSPFIFGYIADPGATLTEDKKVYHEFSIYLYKKDASAPRMMTYRLLMILDTDQMSYSRGDVTPGGSRGLGEERPRLPHNHIWK